MHPAAQCVQIESVFSRSLDTKNTRIWMSNLYIQDFIWYSTNLMAKLLFILNIQNRSSTCAYVNWTTICSINSMIYKGKLQMQIRCGFYICPAVCPKLFKLWFCLNKEKQEKQNWTEEVWIFPERFFHVRTPESILLCSQGYDRLPSIYHLILKQQQ